MSKMTDELTAWLLSYETGRTWYNKLLSDVSARVLHFRHNADS